MGKKQNETNFNRAIYKKDNSKEDFIVKKEKKEVVVNAEWYNLESKTNWTCIATYSDTFKSLTDDMLIEMYKTNNVFDKAIVKEKEKTIYGGC